MSKLSRENTSSKMKGAGDGIKNVPRTIERTPVPSSRKFTATLACDEGVQLKLKKVLDDLEAKQKSLRKSRTVAEITPTKSGRKRSRRPVGGGTSMVLHATPRPAPDEAKETPSGRAADAQRRLQLLVYHRMLLFVWRRSRSRLAMLSESLRRRQDQIKNLEKQVNCLKDLTQSECHKRGEAVGEYQRMENVLQSIRMENSSLIAAKVVLQKELDEVERKFERSCIELENMKNEVNTKNIYMKRLENECHKDRNELKRLKDENICLVDKVKADEDEMKRREEVAGKMKKEMRDLEKRIQKCESKRKTQCAELNKMAEKYEEKVKTCEYLREELATVCWVRDEMAVRIQSLEDKLAETSCGYEVMFKENELLKRVVEKKWWQNTKELVQVSWAVLRHAAYLMLPAL